MFLEAVFVTTFLSGPLTSVCGFSTFEEKEIKVKTSNGEVSVMLWINGPDLSNSKDDTKKYPAVINFPWYPYLMKNDTPQPEDPKKELSRVRSCWGTNPSGGDYYVIHCRLSKEMQMYSDKTSSTCGVEIQNKVYEYITSQLPVDKNKILISGEWGLSNIALFSISKFPERYFGCLVLSIRAIGNAELTMRLSNKHFFLITYNYESSDFLKKLKDDLNELGAKVEYVENNYYDKNKYLFPAATGTISDWIEKVFTEADQLDKFSNPGFGKCPVSKRGVNIGITFQYDGKTYAFCSKNCMARFKSAPKKYLKVKDEKKKK